MSEVIQILALAQVIVIGAIFLLGAFRWGLSEEQYAFYVGYLWLNITPVLIIGIIVSSILNALGIESLFNKLSK
jgi:type III secretory pathway component EscR